MKKRGKYELQKVKKNNNRARIFGLTILIFAILAGAVYYGVNSYVDGKLKRITQAAFSETEGVLTAEEELLLGVFDPSASQSEEDIAVQPEMAEEETVSTEAVGADYGQTGKVVNILLVGQAGRYEETSKLADTIMLFTLNKETKILTVTSFLRDSFVDLPNYKGHTCGWNRINTAYALGYAWYGNGGAMEMLNMTLQKNYGVIVDGDVEIGFDSFVTIVDTLGGLEVNLSGDELTYMIETANNLGRDDVAFYDGKNMLNGEWALHYARMRHANASDSDINRTERQRALINQIVKKLKNLNLLELNELLDAVLPMVITNISTEDMKTYISECLPYLFEITMESNQCPKEGSYWGEMKDLPDGPAGVLCMNFVTNREMMELICTGE